MGFWIDISNLEGLNLILMGVFSMFSLLLIFLLFQF